MIDNVANGEPMKCIFQVMKNDEGISLNVVMPIYERVGIDDVVYVNLPLLGIETYGRKGEDIYVAINEAITNFYIASCQFGKGLTDELAVFGWKPVESAHSNDAPNRTSESVLELTGASVLEIQLLESGIKTNTKINIPQSC